MAPKLITPSFPTYQSFRPVISGNNIPHALEFTGPKKSKKHVDGWSEDFKNVGAHEDDNLGDDGCADTLSELSSATCFHSFRTIVLELAPQYVWQLVLCGWLFWIVMHVMCAPCSRAAPFLHWGTEPWQTSNWHLWLHNSWKRSSMQPRLQLRRRG